nr:hypothetical protein [Tanacetum cinerariifolium]
MISIYSLSPLLEYSCRNDQDPSFELLFWIPATCHSKVLPLCFPIKGIRLILPNSCVRWLSVCLLCHPMRKKGCATWDGGRSTWGGQAKGFGTVLQIKDFANDILLSVVTDDHLMKKAYTDGSNAEVAMDNEMGKPLTESVSAIIKDSSSEAGQASTPDNNSSTLIIDAQRCMSLYFSLCTKLSMDLTITPEPYPHGESTLSCGLDMVS